MSCSRRYTIGERDAEEGGKVRESNVRPDPHNKAPEERRYGLRVRTRPSCLRSAPSAFNDCRVTATSFLMESFNRLSRRTEANPAK